ANSKQSEALVVKDLSEHSPELVVYYANSGMWHWDDIPNSVRHRDISEYLLRNWEPLASIGSHLLLRRNGSSDASPLDLRLAYGNLPTCDWGYVPHFDTTPDTQFHELASFFPHTETLSGSMRVILSPDEGSAVQLDSLHRASFLEFSFEDLKSDRFTLTD